MKAGTLRLPFTPTWFVFTVSCPLPLCRRLKVYEAFSVLILFDMKDAIFIKFRLKVSTWTSLNRYRLENQTFLGISVDELQSMIFDCL